MGGLGVGFALEDLLVFFAGVFREKPSVEACSTVCAIVIGAVLDLSREAISVLLEEFLLAFGTLQVDVSFGAGLGVF